MPFVVEGLAKILIERLWLPKAALVLSATLPDDILTLHDSHALS